MVSILPGGSNWDVIGQALGENVGRALPQAVSKGYERQQGLSAIDQLQQQLQQSGGDITQMLPAIARAYTLNPGLERSGLGQFALQNAKAKNFYGNGQQPNQGQGFSNNQEINGQPPQPQSSQNRPQTTEDTYGVRNPVAMDAKAKQDAIVSGDPARYQQSINEQNTLNNIAQGYKNNLISMAKADGISDEDMADFMEIGGQFPTENPEKWFKDTRAAFAPFKKNFDKLKSAFIPGIGSMLLDRDRGEALKKIAPDVKDLVDMGREKQAREYLASQYVSPIEIAELIHPVTKRQEANLSKLPNGLFPSQRQKGPMKHPGLGYSETDSNPFIPYELAKEKDPQGMQIMQDRLADYFANNVDKDTSLLALANKIWEDKSYHWDQMGPAIRQAQEKGLKLEPHQSAEMGEINSQPPIQSLPDIFKDWWRITGHLRGNK